jgi:hypothetical protein
MKPLYLALKDGIMQADHFSHNTNVVSHEGVWFIWAYEFASINYRSHIMHGRYRLDELI